jgi:hypothetical protein
VADAQRDGNGVADGGHQAWTVTRGRRGEGRGADLGRHWRPRRSRARGGRSRAGLSAGSEICRGDARLEGRSEQQKVNHFKGKRRRTAGGRGVEGELCRPVMNLTISHLAIRGVEEF